MTEQRPPTPEEEAALDAAVGALPVLQPPAALVASTLRGVLAEMADQAVEDAAFDAEVARLGGPVPPEALVGRVRSSLAAIVAEEAAADAALDAAATALPLLEVPAGLAGATLDAVLTEMRGASRLLPSTTTPAAPLPAPANRPWRWMLAAGVVAALALVVVTPGPAPVDTTGLVERGMGERLPDVSLKVAVDRGGRVDRLARDVAYGPGATLYFRASVDDDAALTLVRVDATGAEVVHAQRVTAGDADLALASGPLGWRLDPGEQDAVFALLASPEPLSASQVATRLSGSYTGGSPAAVCSAAQALGARCAAELVKVTP